ILEEEFDIIDEDYNPIFEDIKKLASDVLDLITKYAPKNTWIADAPVFDYIICPKYFKESLDQDLLTIKEQSNKNTIALARTMYLGTTTEDLESGNKLFSGLTNSKTISFSDFFDLQAGSDRYLCLSPFGSGYYLDRLLQG